MTGGSPYILDIKLLYWAAGLMTIDRALSALEKPITTSPVMVFKKMSGVGYSTLSKSKESSSSSALVYTVTHPLLLFEARIGQCCNTLILV